MKLTRGLKGFNFWVGAPTCDSLKYASDKRDSKIPCDLCYNRLSDCMNGGISKYLV
jgi:hypothetical protein